MFLQLPRSHTSGKTPLWGCGEAGMWRALVEPLRRSPASALGALTGDLHAGNEFHDGVSFGTPDLIFGTATSGVVCLAP